MTEQYRLLSLGYWFYFRAYNFVSHIFFSIQLFYRSSYSHRRSEYPIQTVVIQIKGSDASRRQHHFVLVATWSRSRGLNLQGYDNGSGAQRRDAKLKSLPSLEAVVLVYGLVGFSLAAGK